LGDLLRPSSLEALSPRPIFLSTFTLGRRDRPGKATRNFGDLGWFQHGILAPVLASYPVQYYYRRTTRIRVGKWNYTISCASSSSKVSSSSKDWVGLWDQSVARSGNYRNSHASNAFNSTRRALISVSIRSLSPSLPETSSSSVLLCDLSIYVMFMAHWFCRHPFIVDTLGRCSNSVSSSATYQCRIFPR